MTGTPAQIEWAERIRTNVGNEFDRVGNALTVAAGGRSDQIQADTRTVIAILAERRAEAMANDRAGYFIHDWQEISDQVRQIVRKDPRYQAIQARKAALR